MSAATCDRTRDDGTPCGGRLSVPMRGRRTGRWFQTCARCGVTTSTAEAPPELAQPRVATVGRYVPGALPLTWQQRLEDEQP
jgi:hypothetical protein